MQSLITKSCLSKEKISTENTIISWKTCLKSASTITNFKKKHNEAIASLKYLYARIADMEKNLRIQCRSAERLQIIEKKRNQNIRIINERDIDIVEQFQVTVDQIIKPTGEQCSFITLSMLVNRSTLPEDPV